MNLVSGNYQELDARDVEAVASKLDDAWKNEAIPLRQWISVVRGEIERFRNGENQRHFDLLIDAIKQTNLERPSLLDVGASSGFYSEILKIAGVDCEYTGLDYSEAYERLAHELFPGINFKVGDARALPFDDASFDIVLSGCVMLHIAEYEKVIEETARVAKHYAIFNRTPVTAKTVFHQKDAYGFPCLEIWFGEDELLALFDKYSLDVVSAENVFSWPEGGGHRTYLLKKRHA